MPTALIQLVSEQTMPNVLTALALEPAHITLLHTPRTAGQAGWINHALRRAGLKFEIELRPLSAAPDVTESGARVRTACEDAMAAGLAPVVNITGGTKLMSIGAFAATIAPGWPALYVDSENRRFLPIGKTVLPDPLQDGWAALTRAEKRLNVDVVAAAHGCEHVSRERIPLHLSNSLNISAPIRPTRRSATPCAKTSPPAAGPLTCSRHSTIR